MLAQIGPRQRWLRLLALSAADGWAAQPASTIFADESQIGARDRAGRIFQERRLLVPDDGNHESPITQIEISDPVAHELFICVPKEGVCQVEEFTAPTFQPPRSAADARRAGSANLEDLGKQSISGVETVGTRETVVIEAGKIGAPVQSPGPHLCPDLRQGGRQRPPGRG
jgi:hypothetical protein